MKYRTRELTRMQRWYRKFHSRTQYICAFGEVRMEKRKPRWRQIEKQLKKERAKTWKSMGI